MRQWQVQHGGLGDSPVRSVILVLNHACLKSQPASSTGAALRVEDCCLCPMQAWYLGRHVTLQAAADSHNI